MCIVGFLRLQSLRYKNKRENGNLIAKNWQSCEKKIVFWLLKSFLMLFLEDFWYKKLQKSAINSYIYILWTKKLKSRHPTALKRSHWLQSIAITTLKSRGWLQSPATMNLKVSVDCNQNLKLTLRVGIFSNQWLQQYSKVVADCNQDLFLLTERPCRTRAVSLLLANT